MTASTSPWAMPASTPRPANVAGRFIAVGVMTFGALALLGGTLAIGISLGFVERGAVTADSADLAALRAFQPVLPLLAVFGVAHLVAAIGVMAGNRMSLQLALGLGAVDAVAGVLVMFANGLTEKPALDGAGIGAVLLVLGTILFAAVRAVEYDPSAEAGDTISG